MKEVSILIQAIGNEYQNLIKALSNVANNTIKIALTNQLSYLVYSGFLGHTEWVYLQYIPRYLKGMAMRIAKFSANPERDQRHTEEIAMLWNNYLQRMERHQKMGIEDPKLTEFRWQIEELRVSLFAQELKTPRPVSIKRLQKLWEQVRE